jgi:hypothetical protein
MLYCFRSRRLRRADRARGVTYGPPRSVEHIEDAADTGDDTPYLGDPETIYAIIAMFNAAVVGRQRQIAAGSMAVSMPPPPPPCAATTTRHGRRRSRQRTT